MFSQMMEWMRIEHKTPRDKAFMYLDVVMSGDFDPEKPTERIEALKQAVLNAWSEDDWKIIFTHLAADPRCFGKYGHYSFENLFCAQCPLCQLKELAEQFLEKNVEMINSSGDRLTPAEIRMTHITFSLLRSVYDRERTEENRTKIHDFIRLIEWLCKRRQGSNKYPLPQDLARKFKSWKYGIENREEETQGV
jgi:hypothetical protein